jgi:hypothetical protein
MPKKTGSSRRCDASTPTCAGTSAPSGLATGHEGPGAARQLLGSLDEFVGSPLQCVEGCLEIVDWDAFGRGPQAPSRSRCPARYISSGSGACFRGATGSSGEPIAVRTRLFPGGRWIRTFGSPTDLLPLREQSAAFHDGLTVSRPGTEISNPSRPTGEAGTNRRAGGRRTRRSASSLRSSYAQLAGTRVALKG